MTLHMLKDTQMLNLFSQDFQCVSHGLIVTGLESGSAVLLEESHKKMFEQGLQNNVCLVVNVATWLVSWVFGNVLNNV